MELSSDARTSRLDLEADVSCAYNGGTDLPHLRSPHAQNRDTDSVAGRREQPRPPQNIVTIIFILTPCAHNRSLNGKMCIPNMLNRFDVVHACDGQTAGRRTDGRIAIAIAASYV